MSRLSGSYPDLAAFLAFSVLGSTAISWLAGRALWRTLDLPNNSARILASAAALTPLATLWVSNEVAAQNDYLSSRSIQTLSTLAALVVAGGFLIFARSLRQRNAGAKRSVYARRHGDGLPGRCCPRP